MAWACSQTAPLATLIRKVSLGNRITEADLEDLEDASGYDGMGLYIIWIEASTRYDALIFTDDTPQGKWYVGMSREVSARTRGHTPTNRHYFGWIEELLERIRSKLRAAGIPLTKINKKGETKQVVTLKDIKKTKKVLVSKET